MKETRYLIALHKGMWVGAKLGPGEPEDFGTPAWQPVADEFISYYQVSEAIYDEWTADHDGT